MTHYVPEERNLGPHQTALCRLQLEVRLPNASLHHLQSVQGGIEPFAIYNDVI